MLFGVAGGMADWLDLDPSLVRLVWALLILAAGVGLLLYIVAAIVIPEEPIGGVAPAEGASDTQAGMAGGDTATAAGSTGTASDDWSARRHARRAARGQRSGNGAMIFGLALIVVGAWFLIDRYLNIDSALVLPAVLIVLGVILVVGAVNRSTHR
jgi:phage shock protein C